MRSQDLLVTGLWKQGEEFVHIGWCVRDDLGNVVPCCQIVVNPACDIGFHVHSKKKRTRICLGKLLTNRSVLVAGGANASVTHLLLDEKDLSSHFGTLTD